MQHLFVPYELALLAKNAGFDEPCLRFYQNSEELSDSLTDLDIPHFTNKKTGTYSCIAPLYQQLIDWFYDKHKISIETRVGITGKWSGYVTISIGNVQKCPVSYSHLQCKKELLNKLIGEAFKLIN